MPDPREIPQLVGELLTMSKQYLRQETVEPAKRLGKHAAMALGGMAAVAAGSLFLALGLYSGLKMWLPTGDWWVVLARFVTALAAALGVAVVIWRMQSDHHQG
jgi:Putative Actinobacterial Holin-X, holin superfamily III